MPAQWTLFLAGKAKHSQQHADSSGMDFGRMTYR